MLRVSDKLVLLAIGRYPDLFISEAVHCYQDDRTRAGLGALDIEHRRTSHEGQLVSNSKYYQLDGLNVVYRLVLRRPAHREVVDQHLMDGPTYFNYKPKFVTRFVEEQFLCRKAVFLTDMFLDINKRNFVANELRRLRSSMRNEQWGENATLQLQD